MFFNLPEQYPKIKTPWLAFPLVVKKNNYFDRKQMGVSLKKIIFKQELYLRVIYLNNL